MNRSELRALISYWLDDLQADYFTETQVNQWLNNAQKEVQKQLLQAGENWYLKCGQTTSVTNQCDYYIPSDFLEVNRFEIVLSGTAPNETKRQLQYVTLNQQDLIPGGNGAPVYYTLLKNKLRIFPAPDQSTYTLRLQYSYRVSDMTSDTDIPDVPVEYHEYVALLAAYDGFIKDDRVPSTLMAKMDEYKTMMKRDAENRNVDKPRTVVVTEQPIGWDNW